MREFKLPKTPMYLSEFLDNHAGKIANKRVFYILEPLLEDGRTIKFGVAGMQSGHAFHRLNEYNIIYGKQTRTNSCKGVYLHFLGVTEYDRMVQPSNTQIGRLETKLKQVYKSKTEKDRGTERVGKKYLPEMLKFIREMPFVDEPTILREGNRPNLQSDKYRRDHAAFVDSTENRKTRSSS